jgi:hypothetical protein
MGSAVFLGSAQDDKQAEFHLEKYRFIFLAPEKLQQASIQRELKRISRLRYSVASYLLHRRHNSVQQ